MITTGCHLGNKNQNLFRFNWQTTTPVPFVANTPLSGNLTGTMASTNTIYTNIVDTTIKDNLGIELTWTGTPTGTITVMCSNSGSAFYSLTFSPPLAQPAGSADGYLISLTQVPFKYIFVQYVNASGSGSLTAWLQTKDIN